MKKLYVSVISLMWFPALCQTTYSTEDILQKGIEYQNNTSFDKAIEIYKEINFSDPKYLVSQFETINAFLAKKEFHKALELSTSLYNDKRHLELPDLLAIHGIVLSENNQLDQAIAIFDEGLKKQPESTHLLLNKAVVYRKQQQKQQALDLYKKIIDIDPSHSSALLHLGELALDDGKIVEGSLALMTFLMFDPMSEQAKNTLIILNKKYHQNFSNTPVLKYSEKGDHFKDLEDLLNAQVQYHKDFPLKINVDDIAIRNMQAIIDYFETHEIKDGYFENHFGKYLKEIANEGHTKNYLLFSLASISSNFEKEYSRNEKEIKNYLDNFLLPNLVEKYFIGYRNSQKYRVFRENGEKVFIPLNNENKFEGTGIVESFTGTKKADISYKNHDLNGVKNYYNSNGTLTFSETYVDGQTSGPVKKYDSHGKLILETNSQNGKADGKYTLYYPTAGINCTGSYFNDNYNGLSECFYPDGSKKIIANYKNGLFHGEYKRFNEIGQLIVSTNYKENEVDGDYLEYFDDGILKTEAKYEQGKPLFYKTYYPNKKIETNSNYKDFKIVSTEKFSYSGQLLERETYDSKENLASIESYDANNNKYQTHFFKNGKYVSSEFQFSNGILEKNKDKTTYQNFNVFGNLTAEGNFEKSKPVGEWMYYDVFGKLKTKTTFDYEGNYLRSEGFLPNGHRDYKVSYKNGSYYGIYEDFLNDKIKYTQYYNENGLNGPEISYYDNGKTYTNSFYVDDNLEYYKYVYTQSEKLYRKDAMSNNLVISSEYFLSDQPFTFEYAGKNGTFTINETTAVTKTVNLKNGQLHGKFIKKAGKLILIEENYTNNVLQGKQVYNAPTGKRMFDGDFIAGKRHGVYNYYDDLGNIKSNSNYIWNNEHGIRTTYLPGINIKHTEISFNIDEKHGPTTIYGTNGDIIAVFEYYYGIPVSYQTTDKKGQLSNKLPFTQDLAKIEAYYKNGNKALDISMKDYLYNGDYKLYFDNGTLAFHAQYLSGWLNGSYSINFRNNAPYLLTSFKNGKQEGTTTYYEPNGNISVKTTHAEDEIHGTYKIYENNKIKHSYTFDSDILLSI